MGRICAGRGMAKARGLEFDHEIEIALQNLNLDLLDIRRRNLCLKLAQTRIKHKTLDDLFPIN